MRRFIAVFGAAALLSLSIGSASAEKLYNGWAPIDWAVVTCSGDWYYVTGSEHYTYQVDQDGNIVGFHGNATATGVGADGTRYVVVYTSEQVGTAPGPGMYDFNSTGFLILVGQGSGQILMDHTQQHITVTPDGTVVVDRWASKGC